MAVMSMRQVIGAVNDKTIIKIYRGTHFLTKGNWYQDNILGYAQELLVNADLDAETNICKVVLKENQELEDVAKALNNLGMDLVAKDENKGIVFELYMLKNGCLECYTYPKNKEWEKKYFARTTRPTDFRDMLLYCEYNYKYKE